MEMENVLYCALFHLFTVQNKDVCSE